MSTGVGKYYKIIFVIVGYFLITAVVGYFIGQFIDSLLKAKPYGQIVSMIVSYIVSWLGIMLYLRNKK